jgi:hypothetical protein
MSTVYGFKVNAEMDGICIKIKIIELIQILDQQVTNPGHTQIEDRSKKYSKVGPKKWNAGKLFPGLPSMALHSLHHVPDAWRPLHIENFLGRVLAMCQSGIDSVEAGWFPHPEVLQDTFRKYEGPGGLV